MQPYFFADTGKRFVKIPFADILFIEASRNYACIVTTQSTCVALLNLRQLEVLLPPEQFCRIHRSFIVGLAAIHSFTFDKVYLDDKVLPIGETYRTPFHRRILIASHARLKSARLFSPIDGVSNNPN
jgi:DNA-binding LytR/AlgR family response regulator